MSISKIDICNYALALIGEKYISSLNDEDSQPALFCKMLVDQVIDEVLRRHSWNCATKRDTFAEDSSSPSFGYDYQYILPQDCIRVLMLADVSDMYIIEGRKLLTNADSCNAVYIQRITDFTNLDSLCRKALYYSLAIQLCVALHLDDKMKARLVDELEQVILPEARRVNAFEGNRQQRYNSDQLTARF